MSMLTRSLIGLSLLTAVLLISIGCQKQVAVQPEPLFPSGNQSVPVNDPTLKTPEPPEPPKSATAEQGPKPPAGKWQPPTQAEIDAARKADTQRAVINTVKGAIEVELYGKDAPQTVANFVKLVKAKYYDGLTFHRVEKDAGFKLIQGGDPAGNGTGGPGYSIKLEIAPNLKHVAGALAMARSSDPDSAGSQFYICAEAIPSLDGDYAVFGKVVKGLDIVSKIEVGDKMTTVRMK